MKPKAYLKDKVIIVTGASSGIGLASARLFGSYGAFVVMAARRLELLQELAPSVAPEDHVLCVKCDVTSREDCEALVKAAVERFGHLDILVNNAGISMRAMFKDLDLSVLETLMNVNFWGTVYCTKAALPYILESKGQIVGIISVAGFSSLPGRTGYSASKFAVRGFLDALRLEHLRDGINVLVFAPGYTDSNIRNTALMADGSQQGNTPLEEGKLMSAEHVARILASAMAARKHQRILTFLGKITGYVRFVWPRLVDAITYRFIAREGKIPISGDRADD